MTMSVGPLVGSIATEIVCARSCAEMPVEIPSLASIEIVNAVWFGVPLTCVIIGMLQRVGALLRQRKADQSASVLGHEVDGLRRAHLRRDDEVALVLAIIGVHQNEHAPVARVLDHVFDLRRCSRDRPRRSFADEPRHIARQQIDLEIDLRCPASARPNVVTFGVCGMMLTPKRAAFDFVDRQRHAVERDRTLGRDEVRQRDGRFESHARRFAFRHQPTSLRPTPSI